MTGLNCLPDPGLSVLAAQVLNPPHKGAVVISVIITRMDTIRFSSEKTRKVRDEHVCRGTQT
ncbi:hypothetical protein LepocDRAFT_00000810 [Leptothrix ochracea L12]|uniref:Uncharacterized protein n=1 Tax=Leptothrix ochracea L12 TaxID=735332 RepID=I4Z562_9BURK|nr:hypothetical protein LepocDRAFT_00000810 [Leptothrix ochracea L12]